ncbi:hypothetical protein LTR70_001425 [Exophiala xenobiotica]|uniref:Uncharacterized protein n=1 Tax=Lithohypha guttulata TaxID=1690604 RepID=A0ABR0KM75_9EURO|nr:hypothetical protein LTR24_000821 [Lithohypha guttulata]KAK5328104.1 hypothetical protein LTR70_001425 [Exophiala xenobiotica]
MRSLTLLLAILQFLSILVAAHPFIIVNSKITPVQVHAPQRTHHHERRQDFLSELQSAANSILGVGGKKTLVEATTRADVTLPPPAVASETQSSQAAESTSIEGDGDNEGDGENDDESDSEDSNEDDNEKDDSTTSAAASSTIGSETAAATIQSSTTSTAASSAQFTSAPPVPSPTLGSAQATTAATTTPTPTATADSNTASSIPPAGIAVAIILSLLIISLTAWLIFKYHPRSRAWWTTRKQAQFHKRSYRDALDGPDPYTKSPNLRQRALSSNANASASKRQTLESFFVPATAKLGHSKEIKRKPVNWGVETPEAKAEAEAEADSGSEKISMTASAAPMGQIERYSVLPAAGSASATQPVSPMSLRAKESLEQLPPISPMNSVSVREPPPISISISSAMVPADKDKDKGKDLRALPPPPILSLPPLIHAKRGSDGVFRLA